MNAIDAAMHDRLIEVWRDFEADPAVDVAILTGEGGDAFVGPPEGFIPGFLELTPRDLRDRIRQGLGGITRGQHRIYKPIIGAINGWALAGGFELALACDLRIASANAVFGSFELKRGFHHGDGGIVRLVASVGMARTFDIVFTGREVSADEALRMGLVSEVERRIGSTPDRRTLRRHALARTARQPSAPRRKRSSKLPGGRSTMRCASRRIWLLERRSR